MSVANRMTTEWAGRICEESNAKLTQGSFVYHFVEKRTVCAVGLYLVAKMGFENAYRYSHQLMLRGFAELAKPIGKIADEVDVPSTYLCGLNNGFEQVEYRKTNVFVEDDDYKLGVEDGEAIYNLMKEQENG